LFASIDTIAKGRTIERTDMASLLEISEDLVAFRQLLEEADGEITPENEQAIEAWFADLGEMRDAKLDAYAALISEWTLRAAARRQEKERLERRICADENNVKRLKNRLKLFMEAQGETKIETRRYRISISNNGGKQPVEVSAAPSSLPACFQKITIEPDVEAIREALVQGQTIDGCKLLPRGTNLRIS
jgi:hypothetical protein